MTQANTASNEAFAKNAMIVTDRRKCEKTTVFVSASSVRTRTGISLTKTDDKIEIRGHHNVADGFYTIYRSANGRHSFVITE